MSPEFDFYGIFSEQLRQIHCRFDFSFFFLLSSFLSFSLYGFCKILVKVLIEANTPKQRKKKKEKSKIKKVQLILENRISFQDATFNFPTCKCVDHLMHSAIKSFSLQIVCLFVRSFAFADRVPFLHHNYWIFGFCCSFFMSKTISNTFV